VSGSIRAREQRAERAVAGLSRGNRFEDWVTIGEGLLAGREHAMQRAGVTKPYERALQEAAEPGGTSVSSR
jgi:hypothetical protein